MYRRLALSLCLLATACSTGSDPTDAGVSPLTLNVDITDSPFHDGDVEAAIVWVDGISAHTQAEAESGYVEIYEGRPMKVELTALRNGITRRVASQKMPPGEYSQMRLHVDRAVLRMKDGTVYRTQDGTLQMTSQDSSGFKVFLDPPLVLEEATPTVRVLLDFDLVRTFRAVGPKEDPNKFHFHPTIRAVTSTATGVIRGLVFIAYIDGKPKRAPDIMVHVLPPDEEDLDQSIASTLTEVDGSMAVLGLDEGTYDIVAVSGDVQVRVEDVAVVEGETSLVDMTLP